ncbi:hypothetical protein TWF696_000821 [Orbilia brochopaga]|uniref:tRNA pseudouridine(55) synthase n=1 Tax=Orbilia brochopaga TaxID=3140254 RepID=A0AAV9VCY8_9PEZI
MSLKRMTMDGIMAVNKPQGRTSAQIIQRLQRIFNASPVFEEHLKIQKLHLERMDEKQSYIRHKRKRGKRDMEVKIGHGGTLDPMATGVLIVGIGRGTKSLSQFLGCTKEYEAVAIFGASTDTYDREGKITMRKPYGHITREAVEGVLDQFRGDIKQRPPMFSALNLNGKRLYEYAREGIPIPVEIKKRDCHISELEITNFEAGDSGHSWEYPVLEATELERTTAEAYQTMGFDGASGISVDRSIVTDEEVAAEQKKIAEAKERRHKKKLRAKYKSQDEKQGVPESADQQKQGAEGAEREAAAVEGNEDGKEEAKEEAKEEEPAPPPPQPVYHEGGKPPVVHLRMTVSGGTYVRSIVNDIGAALGSAATLVALKRSRQGDYRLGENVIEWEKFENDSTEWEEPVRKALEESDDW